MAPARSAAQENKDVRGEMGNSVSVPFTDRPKSRGCRTKQENVHVDKAFPTGIVPLPIWTLLSNCNLHVIINEPQCELAIYTAFQPLGRSIVALIKRYSVP